MKPDFSAKSYFATHCKRRHEPRKHRTLTPVQKAIFCAARQMIEDGRSVEDAVAWAAREVKSKK